MSNLVASMEGKFPEYLEFPWTKKDHPTVAELEKFFTPKVIVERVIYCPKINVDITDSMGMFGYQNGFIFIAGVDMPGVHCLNDEDWLKGELLKFVGAVVAVLAHYDFFPQAKFSHVRIIPRDYPEIYEFLRSRLGKVLCLPVA